MTVSSLPAARRARIAVIGTGGTFAMHGRHRFDWVEYGESGVVHPIGTLIEQMGELAPDVDLVPIPFRMLGSTAIEPADWLELARLIAQHASADPTLDGFVVTHGTATLEETAWFLDLTAPAQAAIVVTGAQRPANTDGSDAAANLRAALAVATAPGSRGAGALVVMNNQIFAARDVSKAASFELAAFEAPPFGPLGWVDADAQVIWRRRLSREPGPLPSFALDALDALPRVDIVLSYAGVDRVMIDACVAAGARGIVCAGLAPGRPAKGQTQALADAVGQGVVVVQATRTPRGYVPPQRFLEVDGILAGGDLAPQKLRILLILALTQTSERSALQRLLLAA
ncbi:asparaginase [Trinickia sp. YCB016]